MAPPLYYWKIDRTEGAKELELAVPISDKLFLNYLQCKYKAYLKLSGKTGIKGDYEKIIEGQNASYQSCAREHFQQCNQIISPPEASSRFKDIKKQKLSVATDISIVNDRHNLVLDAVELASLSAAQKQVYHPIIYLYVRS